MATGPQDYWRQRRRMTRRLTIIGYAALALLIYFYFDPRLLIIIFRANPMFVVFIILGGGVLVLLAFVAVMNTLRLLRRVIHRGPHEYDPGWAGPLVRATEADEEDLCGLGSERDGCF